MRHRGHLGREVDGAVGGREIDRKILTLWIKLFETRNGCLCSIIHPAIEFLNLFGSEHDYVCRMDL